MERYGDPGLNPGKPDWKKVVIIFYFLGLLILHLTVQVQFFWQVSEPEKWGYSTDWKKVVVYFFGTQQM
ncbi:unnamed protein product [Lathyrus sativus]|nr:unnamed protein product [Lathyrus sativus]